jgi:hypothetical protein
MNDTYSPSTAPSSGFDTIKAILIGAVVALVGANIYLYTQLDGLRSNYAEFRKNMETEVTALRESSTMSTATARRTLANLKDELEAARRQAKIAVGAAKEDALRQAEVLARQLAAEQRKQTEAVKTELTEAVSNVEKEADTKIAAVNTEVGQVKTEVQTTKSELDKTVSDLLRVRGDLDGTSTLVATNGRELEALKSLGQRNYIEFNMKKSKQPQRVGDIALVLKKADVKRNRFTMDVIADDKRVEKKDRGINEPVQFYTSRARQPYELVVNEVRKDQVIGYLSTPKVQISRN